LRKEVKELKQKVEELLAKTNGSASRSESTNASTCYSAEQVVQEIQERNIRKNNVIIFGLPEQNDRNEEKGLVSDMLNLVNIDSAPPGTKHFRTGKTSTTNRPRPVKLIMNCKSKVKMVFKSLKPIKENQTFKDIGIVNDRTPMQMNQYNKIKKEFEERRQNGESDIQIKCFEDVRKIVKIKSSLDLSKPISGAYDKKNELSIIISSMNSKIDKFFAQVNSSAYDLYAITETWLTPSVHNSEFF
ncbi:unnamed protein product, partial [Acanthoscelides obtectus]